MSTKFSGHLTGFNPKGSNECVPNPSGPPKTKFGGRPAVPAGPLKRYPGGAAEIDNGNRRLAKAGVGDGGGSGVRFITQTGFGSFAPEKVETNSKAKLYDTKGGSGVRKGRKT